VIETVVQPVCLVKSSGRRLPLLSTGGGIFSMTTGHRQGSYSPVWCRTWKPPGKSGTNGLKSKVIVQFDLISMEAVSKSSAFSLSFPTNPIKNGLYGKVFIVNV
jgi:hypothetical protein